MTQPRRRSRTALILVGSVLGSLVVSLTVLGVVVDRVEGAADCTSVESYDALRDECYYECDTDEQCEALGKQVDRELDARFRSARTKAPTTKPVDPGDGPAGRRWTLRSTGSETEGTVYTVTKDGLVPRPSRGDRALWRVLTQLLGTREAERRFTSFEVFDDDRNDTAASVWRSDDPDRWHLNVNDAYTEDGRIELVRTLVHEYGHVLTLSGDQVPEVSGRCPRITLSEGCGRKGSYVQAFYAAFWRDYGLGRDGVGSLSAKTSAALYREDRSAFVSEYASTDLAEDVAESFADFVLKAPPRGRTVAADKVRFFADYPELVALRTRLREGAARVTGDS
ncbi:MAG: hypothetical protein PGN07_03395 [Aeromicrobium erythreum]